MVHCPASSIAQPASRQRGGTVLGLIVGLVAGLAVALAVAVYVTKVPVPFLKRGPAPADTPATSTAITPVTPTPSATAGSTANTPNWDPNSPLYGRQPAPPTTDVRPAAPPPPAAGAGNLPPAVAGGQPPARAPANAGNDPLGQLAMARSGNKPAETAAAAYSYFVQAGAYSSSQDAEAQKAKLSFSGISTRVTQREQSGRAVYRVRSGPYDTQQEAEGVKSRLAQLGVEAALVRVQR